MGTKGYASMCCVEIKVRFWVGFKLWTQSNDDLIDKFIVGWRLVVSEKEGICSV